MRRLILCLAVLFCLVGTGPVQAQERRRNSVTVKFEAWPRHGGPIVTVRLEQKVTARFLIDTGANATCLTPDMVEKLKLSPEPQRVKGKQIVMLSHLEIGSWDIPGGEFVILDGAFVSSLKEHKLDGILGTNLLGTCAVLFDWKKQEVTLFYPGKLAKDEVEALGFKDQEASPLPLPLDLTNGHYGITTQIAGNTVLLFIDTGRQRTILPRSYPAEALGKPIWERDRWTQEGTRKEAIYLAPEIVVGRFKGDKQAVVITKEKDGPLTHMLGMDFLAQFNALLDFPAERAYLHPLEGTNLSREYSQQEEPEGMVIGRDKETWKVVGIETDNRFFRAGVRQGDSIESVNEVDVRELVGDQVLAELYRTATPALQITRPVDGKTQRHVILVPKR